MAYKIDELAREEEAAARSEGLENQNFPGKRWLREGGIDGYLK